MCPIFANRLRKLVRDTRADLIFAAPIHFGYLFRAAVALCRRDNIPLVSYFMDDWASTLHRKWLYPQSLGIRWQTQAISASTLVYTNGPGMQAEYLNRYGRDSRILTNVVNSADFSSKISGSQPKPPNKIATIIYTGTIYGAQKDAIENLIRALDILNHSDVICRLALYSDRSSKILKLWGWTRPYVVAYPAVEYAQIPKILAQADILFLPLSFRSEHSFLVRTAAPGKFPEYAASGRPIIIHAPPYADISLLSRQRNFGDLIDKPDPQLLVQAVRRILENNTYRAELARKSIEVVRRYYEQMNVQKQLYTEIAGTIPAISNNV
ncbi:MAG: glycosyltransferase family 4 protein [bacterium]|nr:glycosyltransferase family 4 protein [bacterium]